MWSWIWKNICNFKRLFSCWSNFLKYRLGLYKRMFLFQKIHTELQGNGDSIYSQMVLRKVFMSVGTKYVYYIFMQRNRGERRAQDKQRVNLEDKSFLYILELFFISLKLYQNQSHALSPQKRPIRTNTKINQVRTSILEHSSWHVQYGSLCPVIQISVPLSAPQRVPSLSLHLT